MRAQRQRNNDASREGKEDHQKEKMLLRDYPNAVFPSGAFANRPK